MSSNKNGWIDSHLKQIVCSVVAAIVTAILVALLGVDNINASKCIDPNRLDQTIVGTWEQMLRPEGSTDWMYGGVYRVYIDGDCLAMSAVSLPQASGALIRPNGIAAVSFDGDNWSFTSHLENGSVAEFKLERMSGGEYFGYVYLNGTRADENAWFRVPNQ